VTSEDTIRDVEAFWSTEACGTHFIRNFRNERDFYEQYRRFRYETEWHIPLLVPFAESNGKAVLEIGCGNGADGAMFAACGARYTGVDLTGTAVEATRKHFESLGLSGTFQVEDAERLSFADNTFDIVYSYGVLHHTSNPARAIDEAYRVLRPGGRAIVMLYNKQSFNYYVRIMGYMRLRLLLQYASRLGRIESDKAKLTGHQLVGVRGNQGSGVWQLHYQNLLRTGWRYLKAANFVHHATDGPECPRAFPFTRAQVHELFSRFRELRMSSAHFPLRKRGIGRAAPSMVERVLARTVGWYLMIDARK
jgi:ubiquinone/menaquinone biosynthesis C-methylase UbiE